MMKSILNGLSLGALLLVCCCVVAETDEDRIDNGVISEEKRHFGKLCKHHPRFEIRKIIDDFMIDQGDLSAAEVEARQLERQAQRDEIMELKKYGETEVLHAKLAEIKQTHVQRREMIRQYIEEHEDLQTLLTEHKQKIHERPHKHRHCKDKHSRKLFEFEDLEG